MLLNDRTLIVETVDLRDSSQSIHEYSEEKHGALAVESGSCVRCAKEDGTDDKSHDDVDHRVRCLCRDVAENTLVATDGA